MIGGEQPKLLVNIDRNGNVELGGEMDRLIFTTASMNWELIREEDGLTKQSNDIKWIEWTTTGTYKEQSKECGIGRSLLMSPFNESFTWQTTQITEIIEERLSGYIKFKTENSTYVLSKIYSEATGNPV